jgi:hypothetical protein
MIVIGAVPVGVTLALQGYYKFHLDTHDAIIQGVVIATAIVLVGSLFLCLGKFIVFMIRRRRRP